MNAIIIAGGQGLRMRPLTESCPKCFLPVGDKKIIDWLLKSLKEGGVDKISLVTGYKGELIRGNYPELNFYDDSQYLKSSILRGLFCAQKEMFGPFIASYSDIIYSSDIIKKIVVSKSDFSIVVDKNFKPKYDGRILHPLSEAEKVVIKNGKIFKIGKNVSNSESNGEFIGLAKFSANGAKTAVKIYNNLLKKLAGKPFQAAREFEKAYLTDFFQELIDRGYEIKPVFINDDWVEMDTIEDLEKARKYLSKIEQFF